MAYGRSQVEAIGIFFARAAAFETVHTSSVSLLIELGLPLLR